MSKANNLTDFLTDIANTLREKRGWESLHKINPQDFTSQINFLPIVPSTPSDDYYGRTKLLNSNSIDIRTEDLGSLGLECHVYKCKGGSTDIYEEVDIYNEDDLTIDLGPSRIKVLVINIISADQDMAASSPVVWLGSVHVGLALGWVIEAVIIDRDMYVYYG